MNLAKYIDHTLLKPNAQEQDIIKLCEEAKKYNFASVCVNGYYTNLVHQLLEGSDVKTCTVVGFPLGNNYIKIKAYEAKKAIALGSDEIDMVINIAALKDEKYTSVAFDIYDVVKAAQGRIVKVILETCLLTKEEIVRACEICVEAGAHFVKTSTGFSTGGATVEDVKLMKETVGDKAKVKASGGIRDYNTTIAMINAGADRIGTSSGVEIVNFLKQIK